MERIIDRIEADAASLSISGTSRSAGTVRGIGSVSGRAIIAVGELAIRGIESVNMRLRLRAIGVQLRQEDSTVSDEAYQDLLELQRIGLYSDNVRRLAWEHIFLSMEQERTDQIVSVLLTWPPVETQLFLRQLAVVKLSGWTWHPTVITSLQVPKPVSRSISTRISRIAMMTQSFRNILWAIMTAQPDIVYEIFDAPYFALLQSGHVLADEARDLSATDSLQLFFAQLSDDQRMSTDDDWPRKSKISEHFFLKFLEGAPRDQLEVVVSCTMDSTRRLLEPPFESEQRYRDHPCIPFLSFATRLLLGQPSARELLLAHGFFDTFEFLWFLPPSHLGNIQQSQDDLRQICASTLDIIFKRQVFRDYLLSLAMTQTSWFIALFPDVIQRRYMSNKFKDSVYLTMLGTQRFPCSEEIKNSMWRLVLDELGHSCDDRLLSYLVKLPVDDVRMIFHKLSVSKTSNWLSMDNDMPESEHRLASDSLFRLLLMGLSLHPRYIHTVLSIKDFALLAQNSYDADNHSSLDQILASFFETLSFEQVGSTDSQFRLSLPVTAFVEYLRTLDSIHAQPIVDYILMSLNAFVQFPNPFSSPEPGDSLHNIPNFRHALSFLRFTFRLVHRHQALSAMFMVSGIVDALEQLWYSHGLSNPDGAQAESGTAVSLSCLMIIGSLSLYYNLVERATSSRLGDCLLEVRLRQKGEKYHQVFCLDHETSNLGRIGSMAGLEEPILALVLEVVGARLISSSDYEIHASQFESLLDILTRGREKHVYDHIKRKAARLLLGCISAPELAWTTFIQTLGKKRGSALTSAFFHIITNYIPRLCSPDDENTQDIERLVELNPVSTWEVPEPYTLADRFILLCTLAAQDHPHVTQSLDEAGMRSFVIDVLRGRYNFLGLDSGPSAIQQAMRIQICLHMQTHLAAFHCGPQVEADS